MLRKTGTFKRWRRGGSSALILFIQTLALYKSFTYLLTYLAQRFWGGIARVHFLRSPKPEKKYEKYEYHIGLHLKSIISRVANSVMG